MDFLAQFRNKGVPKVTYESMLQLKPFTKLEVSKGVECYRMPIHRDTHIVVFKYLEQGSEVPSHYHDCKEVVQVVEGKVRYGRKTYGRFDKFVVHTGVAHKIEAIEKTKLFVEYFKVK